VCALCSLRYPACNAHASYYHLWPSPHYKRFPHYLINGKIFEKKRLLNTKCVFRISLQLLSEIFFILRRTERDMIKNLYWPSCKRYSYLILMILGFSRQIFEKYSNIRLHENLSSGSRVVPYGEMGVTKLLVAFRNFANGTKITAYKLIQF
jgi:hypothetical protein